MDGGMGLSWQSWCAIFPICHMAPSMADLRTTVKVVLVCIKIRLDVSLVILCCRFISEWLDEDLFEYTPKHTSATVAFYSGTGLLWHWINHHCSLMGEAVVANPSRQVWHVISSIFLVPELYICIKLDSIVTWVSCGKSLLWHGSLVAELVWHSYSMTPIGRVCSGTWL